MEERKFIQLKKEEFGVKEYIRQQIGKGKLSSISIEYTPVGEKIILSTSKPGMLIGRGGEKIMELTEILKKRFKLENPHIEIKEIEKGELDAQTVADEIAMFLERMGSLKFKVIAYQMIQRIIAAGAKGVEIRLSGKLPSERAKSWRFAVGYLKKTGDTAKVVNKGEAVAETMIGVIGIKVGLLPPDIKVHDQIEVNQELLNQIKKNLESLEEKKEENKKTKNK
ncbi:30S ribosomal protein S3 [Candidatus Pacearchaeota archaeon]|nr:30S ribosomal protein S3 [Candidatus Pacearchaeota archaeon]